MAKWVKGINGDEYFFGMSELLGQKYSLVNVIGSLIDTFVIMPFDFQGYPYNQN